MKNLKICAGMFLGVSVLFLTGCGGSSDSHTLKCSRSLEGTETKMVVTFNDKEDKIVKIEGEAITEIPDGLSADQIQANVDAMNKDCGDFDTCSAKIEGNKIHLKMSGKADSFDYSEDITIKDLKEKLENIQYECN